MFQGVNHHPLLGAGGRLAKGQWPLLSSAGHRCLPLGEERELALGVAVLTVGSP